MSLVAYKKSSVAEYFYRKVSAILAGPHKEKLQMLRNTGICKRFVKMESCLILVDLFEMLTYGIKLYQL